MSTCAAVYYLSEPGHVASAPMTLGSEVRRRRLALGLTQEALAERSGLSPHHLSTLENDHRDPRVSTLIAVANALRVCPGSLLDGSRTGAREPTFAALFESAPPEAQKAIVALLTLAVSSRRQRKKKATGRKRRGPKKGSTR